MSPYSLVPQALRETGKTFRDILGHEAASRVSGAQMGLAKTKLGYELDKDQYEKYLDTPGIVSELLENHPKLSEEQKQAFKATTLYDITKDLPTTPRHFIDTFNNVRKEAREGLEAKREYGLKERELGLKEREALTPKWSGSQAQDRYKRATTLGAARIKAGGKVKSEKISSKEKVLALYNKYGGRFDLMDPIEQSVIRDAVDLNDELFLKETTVPGESSWFGLKKGPDTTETDLALKPRAGLSDRGPVAPRIKTGEFEGKTVYEGPDGKIYSDPNFNTLATKTASTSGLKTDRTTKLKPEDPELKALKQKMGKYKNVGNTAEEKRAQKELAKREVLAFVDKVGVGKEDIKATANLYREIGGWIWDSYSQFIGDLLATQRTARQGLR